MVKPIIEVLAGVPSVVLGYFAIAFINPEIVNRLFSNSNQAFTLAAAGIAVVTLSSTRLAGQDGFRFRSGVELVNVTATVTDRSGRFVPGSRSSGCAGTR